MKFLAVCFLTVLVSLSPGRCAETPEDRYLEIYSWIEEADQLVGEGQQRLAAERYQEAQAGLKDLQRIYPNWNTNVLKLRLGDVTGKLVSLSPSLPGAAVADPSGRLPGSRTNVMTGPDAEVEQLRQELARLKSQNARLEARLREALSVQPAAADPRELAKTAERLKRAEKERDLLVATLAEERSKGGPPVASRAESDGNFEEQLTDALAERDALARSLEKANRELEKMRRELSRQGDRGAVGQENGVDANLEAVRTRLAAYEAVPQWSIDKRRVLPAVEPILFAATDVPVIPKTSVVSTNTSTNGVTARKKYDLPPGSGALFADVERAVDAGRYAEAETKLRDILRQDGNNVRLLDKLAAVLMDQDKVGEAETTLKKALSIDPEDPAALYMLGSLKLRQDKTDEALDLLKLSAKNEPEMPQTQYFLGRALIQKGDRPAAETALRKAILLKPNWGEPHYLLAVLYGTEQPLFSELAKFHYKKAIAGGVTRNPELEKRMENDGATAKP